jgi:hypothetical protein
MGDPEEQTVRVWPPRVGPGVQGVGACAWGLQDRSLGVSPLRPQSPHLSYGGLAWLLK